MPHERLNSVIRSPLAMQGGGYIFAAAVIDVEAFFFYLSWPALGLSESPPWKIIFGGWVFLHFVICNPRSHIMRGGY